MIKTLVLSVFVIAAGISGQESGSQPNLQFPVGDPRRCYTTGSKDLLRLEVIPGGGWDNIQNKEAGNVMRLNYSKCITTDDGRYLVPDGIYTIPKKSSKVDTYAELIMHWNNYTSTLSSTVNAHAGLNLPHVGISGKFSSDYEEVKTRQYFDKTATTRVQVRYVRYTAKTQPDFAVDDALKARLRKIAAHIEMNRTALATYESQLVVRDFGTHVITSVDIGAAMVQVDQIKTSFVKNTEFEKSAILASASASFFSVFGGGFGYSHTTTKSMIDQYMRNRTTSRISTFGGPVFRPSNYTVLNWSVALDNDMVALDRSGDPLYYVVSSVSLSDLPISTVYKVYDYIKEAVEAYYKHNTYRGCTERDSPNFSFMANENDGTCKPPNTNYTFGGVYQTCTGSGFTNLCEGMQQKNPLTGGFSCPEEYEAVLIQDGSKHASTSRHECHRCGLFFHCCHDKTYDANAKYSAYWCAANGHVDQNHGFLFGGLYTKTTFNPVTGDMACPAKFYGLRLLMDLVVCVSDDYELGLQYALPFAGIFSCKSGNPLSLRRSLLQQSSGNQHTIMSYMANQGPSAWPHECPHGFSQHLAVVDNGCEIDYCIQTGALSALSLPKIKRPPFIQLPYYSFAEPDNGFAFNDDGTVWTSLADATKLIKSEHIEIPASETGGSSSSSGTTAQKPSVSLTAGSAAVIAAVCTLAGVLMLVVIVNVYRKRKRGARYRPVDDVEPLVISEGRDQQSGSYGGCQ